MFDGDLAQRTLDLVGVSSVTGDEKELADLVEAWATGRFGADCVRRWRHGLVVAPAGQRPSLALVGHLDTVPPGEPQSLGIRDGRVYGCGASDMKAGVAVMMSLIEKSWKQPVCALFYDQEEGPRQHNGLLPLLEIAPPIDLAVVLEPTSNEVQVGCVGSLHAQVKVKGRRAHSARPWHGKSAVLEALPLLQRLQNEAPREVVVQGQTFREVLTLTQANTRSPRNAVPGLFELNLNYRFAPGKSTDQAQQELSEWLRACAGDFEFEIDEVSPSGDVCLDHPRLSAWIEAEGLVVEPKQAWTDVAQLTEKGIPAVNFGPGEPGQAHQVNEWAPVDAIDACAQKLESLLGR